MLLVSPDTGETAGGGAWVPCGRHQEPRPLCRVAGLLQESPRAHEDGAEDTEKGCAAGCAFTRVHVCVCEEEGRDTLFLYKPCKVNRIQPSHPNHLTGGSVAPNRVIYHLYCHAFEELLRV